MASTKGSARPGNRPTGRSAGGSTALGAGKRPARPAGKQAGKGGGPRGRGPVAPIKAGPPWGLIAIGVAIALFAVGVIGYSVYTVNQAKKPAAERIKGLVDYRKTEKLGRDHVATTVKYPQTPPVGGNHNPAWQNCMGDVYPAQIANEHAVHSLEHGAVWITYNPSLPKGDVAKLAAKVRGKTYIMMSPYPGLSPRISLQAWGYQVKVKSASDKRIDTFITAFREKASVEPGSSCASGTTKTGTDLTSS